MEMDLLLGLGPGFLVSNIFRIWIDNNEGPKVKFMNAERISSAKFLKCSPRAFDVLSWF
jgi:hypothetical protein